MSDRVRALAERIYEPPRPTCSWIEEQIRTFLTEHDRAKDEEAKRALETQSVIEQPYSRLLTQRDEAREIARRLDGELKWASGSLDFCPGGQAEIGWSKGPRAALADFDRISKDWPK